MILLKRCRIHLHSLFEDFFLEMITFPRQRLVSLVSTKDRERKRRKMEMFLWKQIRHLHLFASFSFSFAKVSSRFKSTALPVLLFLYHVLCDYHPKKCHLPSPSCLHFLFSIPSSSPLSFCFFFLFVSFVSYSLSVFFPFLFFFRTLVCVENKNS